MKKEKDETNRIRYGLMPAAFLEFGWLAFLAGIACVAGIFRLITWLIA